MTHFVYILGNGSRWKDNELRYSLRSLSKNFKGDYDVWIVGERPPWVKDVEFVPSRDRGTNPILNVSLKMLVALDYLPEEFILMNDDFYILKPVSEIPVMHGGPMRSKLGPVSAKGTYGRAYRETYLALRELRIVNPLRFDRHTPFPMTKTGMNDLPVAWPSGHFLLKTVYGNLIHETGVFANDVKSKTPLKQSAFWSSESTLTLEAKKFLMRNFPSRSPHEEPAENKAVTYGNHALRV